MLRRGAAAAMMVALALFSTSCESVTSQQQGHQATSGDAGPSPHGKVAVMNNGAAPEAPKSRQVERVYAFSYLGDMDRPIYPTLIGTSKKVMDNFVAAHSKDPLLPYGLQVFTTAEGLACIGGTLKEAEADSESNTLANPEQKESHPLLMVSDWSASAVRTTQFPAASGLALLHSTERCLKKSDAKLAGSLDALIALLSQSAE